MTATAIAITRRVEFDAGHRVPEHDSQCRNLHGHRYVLEVTVRGDVHDEPGNPENGMIIDFAALKRIMQANVTDQWDHAFLAWRNDRVVVDFLSRLIDHKTVILDVVPTVENLVAIAAARLISAIRDQYGNRVTIVNVRLFETPNCWADALI